MMLRSYESVHGETPGNTPKPQGNNSSDWKGKAVKTGRGGARTQEPLTALEIMIDSISDAFAITQFNAGIQFFVRIPS